MELKEAIDKLFEMTDEQRLEVFSISDVTAVLDTYHMSALIENIEAFCSDPKYGDVYLDRSGHKVVVLYGDWILSEKYECPQSLSSEYVKKYYTKTGKNVAYKLKGLFE